MEPIQSYDDAQVHTLDSGFMTGPMDVYEDWVHVHDGDYWIPREQVEKVDGEP